MKNITQYSNLQVFNTIFEFRKIQTFGIRDVYEWDKNYRLYLQF